ncbi:MAG TPA: hypothetical protein VN758_10920 [Solirubrobacterales bacterium]|jgi:hypothetical protein|nr:hypothetical protein [Solirubrobacterales bacterium]
MDSLDLLGVLRHFRPRLLAVLFVAAFYFQPQLSSALLMEVAKERGQRIAAALTDVLNSTLADSQQHRSKR